jgi:glucose-1-phosphate adenylyltransferase
MGIYIFNARLLEKLLIADASDDKSQHDFGKNVIPSAIDVLQVVAYPFTDVKTRAQNYWRDVGTVDAFYDANIELVHVAPELNLYDEEWPIWTYQLHQPPAKFVLDEDGRRGAAVNSMIAGGSIISGALVNQSLLFSNVRVDERSTIFRSVVLSSVKIGVGCNIKNAILDEGCEIPDGMQIGIDATADAARFHVTDHGVVLVTPDMLARLTARRA